MSGKLSIADLLPVSTLLDEPVLVVRTGRSDVRTLMDNYSEDEVVEYLNYSKETAFVRCDAATRRTRRLVKMITVLDMARGKLSDNDRTPREQLQPRGRPACSLSSTRVLPKPYPNAHPWQAAL